MERRDRRKETAASERIGGTGLAGTETEQLRAKRSTAKGAQAGLEARTTLPNFEDYTRRYQKGRNW